MEGKKLMDVWSFMLTYKEPKAPEHHTVAIPLQGIVAAAHTPLPLHINRARPHSVKIGALRARKIIPKHSNHSRPNSHSRFQHSDSNSFMPFQPTRDQHPKKQPNSAPPTTTSQRRSSTTNMSCCKYSPGRTYIPIAAHVPQSNWSHRPGISNSALA